MCNTVCNAVTDAFVTPFVTAPLCNGAPDPTRPDPTHLVGHLRILSYYGRSAAMR